MRLRVWILERLIIFGGVRLPKTREGVASQSRRITAMLAGYPPGTELGPDEFDYRANFLNDPMNRRWWAKLMFRPVFRDAKRMTNDEFYRYYVSGEVES